MIAPDSFYDVHICWNGRWMRFGENIATDLGSAIDGLESEDEVTGVRVFHIVGTTVRDVTHTAMQALCAQIIEQVDPEDMSDPDFEPDWPPFCRLAGRDAWKKERAQWLEEQSDTADEYRFQTQHA